MDLLLVKLIFTLRLDSDIAAPHVFFRLKKPFTTAFRAASCRHDGRCSLCSAGDGCPYQAIFSQELSPDPAVVKRHQKPPLPFALHLPMLSCRLRKGDRCELGLVLVGRAADHAGIFCEAVARMFQSEADGAAVKADVVAVESAGCTGFRNVIRLGEGGGASVSGLATISLEDLVVMNTLPHDRIRLRIHTPMCNLSEGKPVRDFSFSTFVMPLLRRISSLGRYYYGSALDLDFRRLASLSEAVAVTEQDFHWVDRVSGAPGGIVGSGVLVGDLAAFHSALILGEYLNCGKGAAFGSGRYEILR